MGPTLRLYIYIYIDKKGRKREAVGRERQFDFLFLLFAGIFDMRNFGRRNSSGQERKFIYSTRDTREYQKHEISPRIQVISSGNPKFRYFLISTAF